ncbi:hypothetical protein [Aestuariimicrobium sp. Y1814]|uniref:hypothetical protein n=1 Tax=Aestuariimicrobium sp. Y1814 TaxID=3418742 RepID=UPI003DA71060
MTTSDAPATRPLNAELLLTDPAAGPLLALSPHLDDVIFSACAPVLARPLEVWTVFAGEPTIPVTTAWDDSCGFRDSADALATRRGEDRAAFAGSQATVRHLAYLDGPYTDPARRTADLVGLRTELGRWLDEHPGGTVLAPACAGVQVRPAVWDRFRRHHEAPADSSRPTQEGANPQPGSASTEPASPVSRTLAAAKDVLRGCLHRDYQRRRAAAQRKGLAVNNDHVAVRDAVLEVAGSRPGVGVVLYEDLPYLWAQPADSEVARLTRMGLTPVEFFLPVDVAEKFRLIQAYASQVQVMDPQQHRLSRPGFLPERERYWQLANRRSAA